MRGRTSRGDRAPSLASSASISLSLLMICSGVCRFVLTANARLSPDPSAQMPTRHVDPFSGGRSLGRPGTDGAGADGIFADNTRYSLPRGWHLEGEPDKADLPAEYYRNGGYQADLWKADMKGFFARAIPWLAERGKKLVPNFGGMAREPEEWQELAPEPHVPFAAMEEGAFVHAWGKLGAQGNFVFHSEERWLKQVNVMRALKKVRALMNVHGPTSISEQADQQPLVDRFDLPVHRGVILLKPGKLAGDRDNP